MGGSPLPSEAQLPPICDFYSTVLGQLPVRGRNLRLPTGLCQCRVDRLVKQSRIHDLGPSLVGHDEDGRSLRQADTIAQRLVRLHLLRKQTAGIHHERHALAMCLEPPPRKRLQVILAGDAHLIGEDIATEILRNLGRHLVLEIARRYRRIEAPDVHAQRVIMPHQRDMVPLDRLVHDRKRVRARGALQVFELVDRHLRTCRRLHHRRVFEGVSLVRRG